MIMAKFGTKRYNSSLLLAKSYGRCVITHAVPTKRVLFSILKSGIIKKPSNNDNTGIRVIERVLNIKNCVFLSAGWEYNSTYHQ